MKDKKILKRFKKYMTNDEILKNIDKINQLLASYVHDFEFTAIDWVDGEETFLTVFTKYIKADLYDWIYIENGVFYLREEKKIEFLLNSERDKLFDVYELKIQENSSFTYASSIFTLEIDADDLHKDKIRVYISQDTAEEYENETYYHLFSISDDENHSIKSFMMKDYEYKQDGAPIYLFDIYDAEPFSLEPYTNLEVKQVGTWTETLYTKSKDEIVKLLNTVE